MKLRTDIEMMRLKEEENREHIEKYKELLELEQIRSQKYLKEIEVTKELLTEKDEEIQKLHEKNDNNINFNSYNTNKFSPTKVPNNNFIREIKLSVDTIIECLSKPNDSKNLLKVSKDLLNLQEIIDTNLKSSDNKISRLIAEKRIEINGGSNKIHKYSPSSHLETLNAHNEANELNSNFNLYKNSYNY